MSEEIREEMLEELEELSDTQETGDDAISDDELDEVTGGASVRPGNKTFRTRTTVQVFNTFKVGGRKVVRVLPPNTFLRYAKLGVVAGTNQSWVNFGQYSPNARGPWVNAPGWVMGDKCSQV